MDRDRWRRIEQVLDTALARAPDDWSDVLDASCSGDPELRAEVEALLRRVNTAERFLDSPPSALAAALVGEAQESETVNRDEGRRIGAYRIVREIGRGGMSRVFLAERADGEFEQRVALKLLRPGLDSEIDRLRFRAERQILATLDHPNVARLLDGGITDDGVPYLVLEYIEGKPIDRYCAEHDLSLAQRLALFMPVLDAVQYAHQHFVVHRDLKPSNILVTPQGVVKLLDFGLAKLLEPSRDGDLTLTQTGQRWMTPEYAAPEQVRAEPATTLTDVYQLGAVLYELLTGSPPFGKRARGLHELEDAVLREPPRLPSSTAPERKRLRGDVDAIVTKALRKEPDRRYVSAAAFGEDLQRFLDGRPVQARPDSLSYRTGKFVRRNAAAVVVAGLIAASLIAATVVSIRGMREAQRARLRAEQSVRRASASVGFETLIFRLLPMAGAPMTYQQLLARGRDVLDKQYRGDPIKRIELSIQFAQNYFRAGDDSTGRVLLDRATGIADSIRDPSMQGRTRCEMADAFGNARQPDTALALLRQAHVFLARAPDVDRGTLNACDAARGQALIRSHPDSAYRLFMGIANRYVAEGDTADDDYATNLTDAARALYIAKRDREALATMLHVSDLEHHGLVADPKSQVVILFNVASSYWGLGEYRSAREWLAHEMPLVPSIDSAADIAVFAAYTYGSTLYRLSESDSAEFWLTQSLSRGDVLGIRYRLPAHLMLARIAMARGRRDDALQHAAVAETLYAKTHANPTTLPAHLAYRIATTPDRLDRAAVGAMIRAALDSLGYPSDSSNRGLIDPLLEAAEQLIRVGAYDDASRFAALAARVASFDSVTARQSGTVGEAQFLEARAELRRGNLARTRELLGRAIPPLSYGYGTRHPVTVAALALRDSIGRQ